MGKRIKTLREELGISRIDLANSMNRRDVTIGYWERDEHVPNSDNLLALAKRLKTTPEYLKFRTGTRSPQPTIPRNTNGMLLPVISLKAAKNLSLNKLNIGDANEWRTTAAPVSSNSFAIRPKGDASLSATGNPPITETAYVVVDPAITAMNGSIILVVFSDNEEATLKILIIDGPNKYLKSINQQYKSIPMNDDCIVLGVVKRIEYDTDSTPL